MNDQPSMLKAALISGLAFGFVGSIPFVNLLNCACCALVIGGGLGAAFLYSRECKPLGIEFRPGKGAVVGLISGIFYAISVNIFGTLIQMAMGMNISEAMDQFVQGVEQGFEQSGADIPPIFLEILANLQDAGPIVLIIFGLLFWGVLGLIFGTIGGLIGGAIFKVERPLHEPDMG
jgi:hypothetical protein